MTLKALLFGIGVAVSFSGSAYAFCMFSCDPTEANARSVFENLVRRQMNNAEITVTSFAKTDGATGKVMGRDVYQMSIQATVELPQGASHQCNPDNPRSQSPMNILNCSSNQAKYYPPGHKLNYTDRILFEKTERGWRAADGNIY